MNFIFFNPDEMRANTLGCQGNPVARTPHIDRLAAEGTRFAQTSCQSPLCSPSRCSFLTGWYPHVRGHRNLTRLIQEDEPNLLRSLKENGYDVLYIGKNDSFSERATNHAIRLPGFTVPKSVAPVRNHATFNPDSPENLAFLFDPIGESVDNAMDTWKTRSAINYIRSKPKDPFALFLALEVPHPPYSAPQPYHDLIDPESLPELIPPGKEGAPAFHRHLREDRGLDSLSESVFRKIQAVYLGQVAFADYLLGQVVSAVEDAGLAEETAIIFFSDHGDYAGDYGLVEKWQSGLEDVITQVPFIMKVPGGKKGHVVETPTELFDLMPTVLEIAGIEPKSPHFARSRTEEIFSGAKGDPARVAYCEGGYCAHDSHAAETLDGKPDDFMRGTMYYPKFRTGTDHPEDLTRTVMARSSTHKLIYRATGENEFYDLLGDPSETTNLWKKENGSPEQGKLLDGLLHWLVTTSDVIPFAADSRHFPVEQMVFIDE